MCQEAMAARPVLFPLHCLLFPLTVANAQRIGQFVARIGQRSTGVDTGQGRQVLCVLCSAGVLHCSHLSQHGRGKWCPASVHSHQPVLRRPPDQAAGPAKILALVSPLLSRATFVIAKLCWCMKMTICVCNDPGVHIMPALVFVSFSLNTKKRALACHSIRVDLSRQQ